jgi:acyl carrier protein
MDNREVLVRFVAEEFLRDDLQRDIPEDLDLIESGIIDSLGLLKVVAFLEQRLGVPIPPEAMVPASFRSIGAMLETVATHSIAAPVP